MMLFPDVSMVLRPRFGIAPAGRFLSKNCFANFDAEVAIGIRQDRPDRNPILGGYPGALALPELRLLHAAGVPTRTPQTFVCGDVSLGELPVPSDLVPFFEAAFRLDIGRRLF